MATENVINLYNLKKKGTKMLKKILSSVLCLHLISACQAPPQDVKQTDKSVSYNNFAEPYKTPLPLATPSQNLNEKIAKLNFTKATYPKVDGSTSNYPLGRLIALKSLNIPYKLQTYYDNSQYFELNGTKDDDDYFYKNIVHTSTHDSYINLINKKVDLALEARLPSADEIQEAKKQGVELEAKPIALDGFVFVLNTNNPISNLTVEQIQKIYMGKITNWNEVGGNSEKINAYQRELNSGSEELMRDLVMKNLPIIDTPYMIISTMSGLLNKVAQENNAIGYSIYYYVTFMMPDAKNKLCSVNGILPNKETITNKKYTYTTEVYAVIRKDLDKNSTAYQLREWLFTQEGQKVVAESGYVPIMN